MTGAVIEEVEQEEDASAEVLAASILLSLLLLRYSAGLRRLSAEHLSELQTRALVELAKVDFTDRRRVGARAVDDLVNEIDALVAGIYVQMLRDLQRQLDALAVTIVEHQTRQINAAVAPGAAPDRAGLSAAVAAALIAGASLSAWLGRSYGGIWVTRCSGGAL